MCQCGATKNSYTSYQMGLSSTLHVSLTPPNRGASPPPWKLQPKGWRSTKMLKQHIWEHTAWLWSDAMNNRTAFANAANEWTQIENSMWYVRSSSGLISIVLMTLYFYLHFCAPLKSARSFGVSPTSMILAPASSCIMRPDVTIGDMPSSMRVPGNKSEQTAQRPLKPLLTALTVDHILNYEMLASFVKEIIYWNKRSTLGRHGSWVTDWFDLRIKVQRLFEIYCTFWMYLMNDQLEA